MSDNPFQRSMSALDADELVAQLTIYCGSCGGKQDRVEGDSTIVSKIFVFECPNADCDRKATRTIIKFPRRFKS